MEHHLLTKLETGENPSPQALLQALSLISNPSTSDSTLSSLLRTLTPFIINSKPNSYPFLHHHILRFFSLLSYLRPHHLHHGVISAVVREFSLLPSTSTRSLADALACLCNIDDETTFLSLVLRPCISVRHWLLLNVSKFDIRPSVLLTVLLGFTKDPFPYIRSVALDGLANFCKCIVVDDESLIQGCYFGAVELLFDPEESVRCSAVHAVSACGQLIVASKRERSKRDWSDALFIQLCSIVRDMSVKVRVEVFNALEMIEIVSEHILLQTLSKKALSATKELNFHGQYTEKLLYLPASSASFAFLHGLEDEFNEVRESACRALRAFAILSADFSGEVVNLLIDVLNDDSMAVRLQALDTMHHMAMFGHLKVQQAHLHMFLGILLDSHSLIRGAARKVLKLTDLPSLAMFKMCVDGLIRDLELYPQDETEVFSALFVIGQNHGKFLVSMINEVSQMIEPSSGGKLGFENSRKASYLVLATSAPVSIKQQTCSIPPRIFSYAVTILGRISHGLADIAEKRPLLAYLSYCSRFTFVSASEYFKMEECVEEGDVQLTQRCEPISKYHIWSKLQLKEAERLLLDFQLEQNNEINCINIILQMVIDIWSLLKLGLTDEVTRTLRSLKTELGILSKHNHAGELVFTLQYIDALERLGRLWSCFMFNKEFYFHEWRKLETSLENFDGCLRGMRYKFIGLNKEDKFLIFELLLANCILTLCNLGACSYETTLKKLHSVMSHIKHVREEGSTESSTFVIEVQQSLSEIDANSCRILDCPHLLLKSLEHFTPKKVVLSGNLKYMKAELQFQGNDFQNPLPFISGLPVGVSLDITLQNISGENRLWIQMSLEEKLTQFVFLNLLEIEGHDEVRRFTFVAPFYQTPRANSFALKICIVLECMSDDDRLFRSCGGPKHEVVHLSEEKEVYFSVAAK